MASARRIALVLASMVMPAAADDLDPRGVEFFENKIRPVLVERCYECHSGEADEIKAGLRVDFRAGLLTGGDSGPAIVPAKPDESLLLSALRGEDYAMPPDELLPADVVADFEKWIAMGAPDPREGDAPVAAESQIDLEAGREFWSFRPLTDVALPTPSDAAWSRTDIDRLIRARQEQAELAPGPDADRRVLARRAYFDLIGLPPSPEELDAFVADESPAAWAELIDRLLESPHFGERWGRHWLDVARYADSTGGGRSLLYRKSWRYRDYVISAFNRDKPFDRFILEQVAGDLLPYDDLAVGAEQLIATAFLAIGPYNYEDQDKEALRMDVVDEQIDTVGRAFLGMTLGCARCHDHKFDPVPTTDYYALAGIFRSTQSLVEANVSSWVERPLPVAPQTREELTAYTQRAEELETAIKRMERYADLPQDANALVGFDQDDESKAVKFTGAWSKSKSQPGFVGAGYRYASGAGAAAAYSFQPGGGEYEVRVSYTAHSNRSPNALVRVAHEDQTTDFRIDQREPPPINDRYVVAGRFQYEKRSDAPVTVTISTEGADGIVVADSVMLVPTTLNERQQHQADVQLARVKAAAEELPKLKAELENLKANAPEFPPEVMCVTDEAECGDYVVCLRGNPHQLGEKAPRGFLSVIVGDARPAIPTSSSGRLELARWIATSENPLTARVIVNRVWAHLFGRGLVRTVDNFGATGERPTHPELLDWLAAKFMSEGWSIKSLIRDIMLSRTYQLASSGTSASDQADPGNALLTRQNRKRLEVECLLDSMLSLSGELDLAVGGNTVRGDIKREYGYAFDLGRRAVYLPVFRNQLPPAFAEFDFPDPNLSTGQRTTTTLSTQALLLMNSPFALERAKLAAAALLADESDAAERIDLLFTRALGRAPTTTERRLALKFVQSPPPADDEAEVRRWTEICLSVFGTIDFRYIE